MQVLSNAAAYRALESHDARFDGRLFVGVKSTGIYCRPVCPARTPKFENCTFFGSAAAAQEAGYRPCLRCRPETAPQLAAWRGTSNTVSRAMALIAEGALDGESHTVDALAARLGIGERQLRRLFLRQMGASPIAIAQTRRVLFAKQLIHDTSLPMTEIALAAGFRSLRRFNEVFQNLFHRPPGSLRGRTGKDASAAEGGITLRIRYRPPYDWESMLRFLAARAIPGVEVIEDNVYHRTIEIDGKTGTVSVKHLPRRCSLCVTIHLPEVKALPAIVHRVRKLFDLGANIEIIEEHLSLDKRLAPLIARHPGLRTPGAWDEFELAIRAVLGQQISVAAARRFAGRLVAAHGKRLDEPGNAHPALTHVFPAAHALADLPVIALKMPASRLKTLKAVAQAAVDDPHLFRSLGSAEQSIERLRSIPGVGEWTAQYIALRALREADAFPSTDIGLLRGTRKIVRGAVTAKTLLEFSERWRPWRAYAAQHLWTIDAHNAKG